MRAPNKLAQRLLTAGVVLMDEVGCSTTTWAIRSEQQTGKDQTGT